MELKDAYGEALKSIISSISWNPFNGIERISADVVIDIGIERIHSMELKEILC